jgi:hypothetical protein
MRNIWVRNTHPRTPGTHPLRRRARSNPPRKGTCSPLDGPCKPHSRRGKRHIHRLRSRKTRRCILSQEQCESSRNPNDKQVTHTPLPNDKQSHTHTSQVNTMINVTTQEKEKNAIFCPVGQRLRSYQFRFAIYIGSCHITIPLAYHSPDERDK